MSVNSIYKCKSSKILSRAEFYFLSACSKFFPQATNKELHLLTSCLILTSSKHTCMFKLKLSVMEIICI